MGSRHTNKLHERQKGEIMARWVDYEPYKDRSSAEFRAKREMCGLSTYDVGQDLGVAANTVKRWENPKYFPPSPEAWDYIDRMYAAHLLSVDHELDRLLANAKEGEPIVVTWCRNGMGASDADVGRFNAVSQAVAESLIQLGHKVTFRWIDAKAEETQREVTSSFYRTIDPDANI